MSEIKKNNNWYALYTSPRAEKQVKNRLDAMAVECWLPLHRSPRVWSDRIKMVDVPLYNSYLFVKCPEDRLHGLSHVYGVVRVVYHDAKPAVIRQKEIDAIKEFLDEAAGKPLYVGDEVEILRGAMKNLSGRIRKIRKNYLVLYLEQLGATVSIRMEEVAPTGRIR